MLSREQRRARADARICFSLAGLAGTIAILAVFGVIAMYPLARQAADIALAADATMICALLTTLSLCCSVMAPVLLVFGILETRRF